jgi:hypothetical protein
MVERVNLEPTMEEIVVALRETRRGATGTQPYAVVSRPSAGNWTSGTTGRSDKPSDSVKAADAQNGAGSTDINDLRDGEIERLLADNMRLNERVVFLLKVLERDQTSNSEFAALQAALETERGALLRDVKAALGAELRPVLQVLLRLLEKQRAAPLEAAARRTGPEAASVPTPVAAPPDWIADPGRELGSQGESRPKKTGAATSLMPQQPKLRQRMARVLDASALLVPFCQATHLQTSVARWRPVGWQA